MNFLKYRDSFASKFADLGTIEGVNIERSGFTGAPQFAPRGSMLVKGNWELKKRVRVEG